MLPERCSFVSLVLFPCDVKRVVFAIDRHRRLDGRFSIVRATYGRCSNSCNANVGGSRDQLRRFIRRTLNLQSGEEVTFASRARFVSRKLNSYHLESKEPHDARAKSLFSSLLFSSVPFANWPSRRLCSLPVRASLERRRMVDRKRRSSSFRIP